MKRTITVTLSENIKSANLMASSLGIDDVNIGDLNVSYVKDAKSYDDIKEPLAAFVLKENDPDFKDQPDRLYITTTSATIAAFIMSPNFPGFAIPSTIEVRQITITTRKNAV